MPVVFVPEADLTKTAATAAETRAELDRAQQAIASRARGNLAAVRDRGRHRVTVSKGAVDRFVILEGEAALAVEVGHVSRGGRVVRGAYVLRNAVG